MGGGGGVLPPPRPCSLPRSFAPQDKKKKTIIRCIIYSNLDPVEMMDEALKEGAWAGLQEVIKTLVHQSQEKEEEEEEEEEEEGGSGEEGESREGESGGRGSRSGRSEDGGTDEASSRSGRNLLHTGLGLDTARSADRTVSEGSGSFASKGRTKSTNGGSASGESRSNADGDGPGLTEAVESAVAAQHRIEMAPSIATLFGRVVGRGGGGEGDGVVIESTLNHPPQATNPSTSPVPPPPTLQPGPWLRLISLPSRHDRSYLAVFRCSARPRRSGWRRGPPRRSSPRGRQPGRRSGAATFSTSIRATDGGARPQASLPTGARGVDADAAGGGQGDG